jgi:hypothetical protein
MTPVIRTRKNGSKYPISPAQSRSRVAKATIRHSSWRNIQNLHRYYFRELLMDRRRYLSDEIHRDKQELGDDIEKYRAIVSKYTDMLIIDEALEMLDKPGGNEDVFNILSNTLKTYVLSGISDAPLESFVNYDVNRMTASDLESILDELSEEAEDSDVDIIYELDRARDVLMETNNVKDALRRLGIDNQIAVDDAVQEDEEISQRIRIDRPEIEDL